jgi:hypothetical protein
MSTASNYFRLHAFGDFSDDVLRYAKSLCKFARRDRLPTKLNNLIALSTRQYGELSGTKGAHDATSQPVARDGIALSCHAANWDRLTPVCASMR